jgi:hypothetical protein
MVSRSIFRPMALAVIATLPVSAGATIVVDWNNAALAEVRASRFGPPVAARALAVAHTCMYDAWSAYDQRAIGSVVGSSLRRPVREHSDANKTTAISFAAYRCLLNLFPAGVARLEAVMRGHGYDPNDRSTDVTRPQGIGNVAANAVIASRRNDGSNQYGDLNPGAYSDYTRYVPLNQPLPYCTPLTPGPCPPLNIANQFRWQPLINEVGAT